MKLTLEPLPLRRGLKRPNGWIIRDEQGADRGVVHRRARKTSPYWMRGKGLHALFPVVLFGGHVATTSPEKVFDTLKQVREFIANDPEQHWAQSKGRQNA